LANMNQAELEAELNNIAAQNQVKPQHKTKNKEEARVWVDEVLERCFEEGAGEFNITSTMGQRFTRWMRHAGPQQSEYRAIKSGEVEKREFRKKWCKEQYDNTEQRRAYSEKRTKVRLNDGVYMPFGLIVTAEGGWQDQDAIKAALNYVAKCICMRGEYLEFNEMTNRWEYLYVKKKVQDQFARQWATYQEPHTYAQWYIHGTHTHISSYVYIYICIYNPIITQANVIASVACCSVVSERNAM
jgi:hypothetical protein